MYIWLCLSMNERVRLRLEEKGNKEKSEREGSGGNGPCLVWQALKKETCSQPCLRHLFFSPPSFDHSFTAIPNLASSLRRVKLELVNLLLFWISPVLWERSPWFLTSSILLRLETLFMRIISSVREEALCWNFFHRVIMLSKSWKNLKFYQNKS